MIRGLKVALIVYGVVHVLLGLAFILTPYQLGSMFGLGEIADYVPYPMALLGGGFIAASFLFIVTGLNPLEHISGVKFAILWSSLGIITGLYSIARGAVDFSQAGMGIILDVVFAIAFLALYPYRKP
ncbi:hypothetical protein ACFLVG_05015 [Chloroflexota bacterium]